MTAAATDTVCGPIPLPARLDLSAAAPLLAQLQAQPAGDLVLDGTKTAHLGALCLQVLLAAATRTKASGHSLSLINISDRVLDQMRVMGMTPEAISEGRT